jgi:queuine/archaeosine tRNA-ribosyltransferase
MSQARHVIQFIASLTINASSIHKLVERLEYSGTVHKPLQSILTTPVFSGNMALETIREMKDNGHQVMFDSGGYYVQTGKIDYSELFHRLMRTYERHQWADIYVLPDNVPRSQDSMDVIAEKVTQTIEQSVNFFCYMPDELKPRAMPVVHGYTYSHIDRCFEAYIKLGVKQIGFGSFGTVGKNSQVNVMTQRAFEMARYVVDCAHQLGMRVHMFGLGVPVVVMMLYGIRADSFDSSSWLKAAGFGQIFLPLMRAYNISHRNSVSDLQKGLKLEDFRHYCGVTGHQCALCDDIRSLQESKSQRAAHNLIVMAETIEMLNTGDLSRVPGIYEHTSKRYQKEFDRWLPPN